MCWLDRKWGEGEGQPGEVGVEEGASPHFIN